MNEQPYPSSMMTLIPGMVKSVYWNKAGETIEIFKAPVLGLAIIPTRYDQDGNWEHEIKAIELSEDYFDFVNDGTSTMPGNFLGYEVEGDIQQDWMQEAKDADRRRKERRERQQNKTSSS